jgi:cytochrome d ubiquinol oxidase subunit I
MDASSTLMTARGLMGDTLGFHILFALLGVGLPFLMSVFEGLGLWYKDADYTRTARAMGFAVATLFVTGAISGTIVSFQLNLLWPHFMEFANPIIGLPFVLEGFAFLVEGVFLGIYLFSWERLSPMAHWLCSFPLWLGSFSSAFLITTVNGWMNSPEGFTLLPDGSVTDIHPWRAMFNTAAPYEITHSILAYYLTATFLVAAIFAWKLLRTRAAGTESEITYQKKMLTLLLSLAFFFATAVGLAGDESGKNLAVNQPLDTRVLSYCDLSCRGDLRVEALAHPGCRH